MSDTTNPLIACRVAPVVTMFVLHARLHRFNMKAIYFAAP